MTQRWSDIKVKKNKNRNNKNVFILFTLVVRWPCDGTTHDSSVFGQWKSFQHFTFILPFWFLFSICHQEKSSCPNPGCPCPLIPPSFWSISDLPVMTLVERANISPTGHLLTAGYHCRSKLIMGRQKLSPRRITGPLRKLGGGRYSSCLLSPPPTHCFMWGTSHASRLDSSWLSSSSAHTSIKGDVASGIGFDVNDVPARGCKLDLWPERCSTWLQMASEDDSSVPLTHSPLCVSVCVWLSGGVEYAHKGGKAGRRG